MVGDATMFEADEEELSRAEDRQISQAIEMRELELAIADDHRRLDQSREDRGYFRAALGLMRHSGGASKG
jgi:hypothetical protein